MPLSTIQVKSYLDRISVSESNRTQLRQGPCGQHALEAVATLQRQHLKHVPFENLDLMYSSHHSLLQDTDSVFDRVVTQQRGGVCDQIHLLFMELLKHFGFSVYCTGSRINSAASLGVVSGRGAVRPNENIVPKFGPWVHLNTIVTIGHCDYVVDTGHGPSGFPCPVPLIDGDVAEDIRGRQRRMLYDRIPSSTNAKQKWWRMQIRYNSLDPWLDVWAFTETEWQVMDFQLLRLGYSKLGTGWVEPTVCCFRTIYEGDTPVGFMLLVKDQIMRGYKGTVEVLEKFYSELDRILSLEKEFGIILNEKEQRNIRGHIAEIQDDGFDYYG